MGSWGVDWRGKTQKTHDTPDEVKLNTSKRQGGRGQQKVKYKYPTLKHSSHAKAREEATSNRGKNCMCGGFCYSLFHYRCHRLLLLRLSLSCAYTQNLGCIISVVVYCRLPFSRSSLPPSFPLNDRRHAISPLVLPPSLPPFLSLSLRSPSALVPDDVVDEDEDKDDEGHEPEHVPAGRGGEHLVQPPHGRAHQPVRPRKPVALRVW